MTNENRSFGSKDSFAAMTGLAALVILPAVADPVIEVIGSSDDSFQLTLKVDEAIDIEEGHQLLLPTAVQICAGFTPRFGRYEFSSSKSVDGQARPGDSFVLVQEVACGGAENRQDKRASRQLGDGERSEIERVARARTLAYYKALAAGDDLEALAMFSGFSAPASPYEGWRQESGDDWLQEQAEFRVKAGALGEIDVWQVTVYVDPASAPEPGIYVATDLEVSYENLTVCGYFIWVEDADGTLLITRREVGEITADVVSKMSDSQLVKVRSDFRCRPNADSG